jgi:membrane protein implicated in regulation of membrane protease activity
VLVDGKEWAARLDGESIPAPGTKVVVTKVGGAQLLVRAL